MNNLTSKLIPFLITLQFLTRLPVTFILNKISDSDPLQDNIYTPGNMSRTLKYYPVVGLIIGAALILLIFILQMFAQYHTFYIAGLAVTFWVFITGGLHLDGVADMADAWVGGLGDKEKTLTIMKDPVCGPFGVMAIVFMIFLKIILIFELLNINYYLILIPPLIARIGVVVLLMVTPYVREQGMGSKLISIEQKQKNSISVIIFFILGFVLLSVLASIAISLFVALISVLFAYLYRMKVIQRLGGVTGDVAGAFIEYMELIVLFSIATLLMK